MSHEIAYFAFQTKSLLFGGFGEFLLQRILLSTVAFLFTCVMTLTFCHSSAFPRFVKGYCMNPMLLTFRAVRSYFFRNVHCFHYQLSIKKTCAFLYLFAIFHKLIESILVPLVLDFFFFSTSCYNSCGPFVIGDRKQAFWSKSKLRTPVG
jgi:hypothetical protein